MLFLTENLIILKIMGFIGKILSYINIIVVQCFAFIWGWAGVALILNGFSTFVALNQTKFNKYLLTRDKNCKCKHMLICNSLI